MKLKRSLAWLLSIVMLMTMLPNTAVFALDGLKDPSQKVEIEFVPLKYKDAVMDEYTIDPHDEAYGSPDEIATTNYKYPDGVTRFRDLPLVEETTRPEISDIDLNTEYMIGIKINGLDRISEAQYGLINLTIPFMFNSEYIKITDKINSSLGTAFERRLGMRLKENVYSAYYLTGTNDEQNYTLNPDSLTAMTGMVSIPLKTSINPPPNKGDANFYIAAIKYKFIKLPEATGTKIVTLDMTDSSLYSTYSSYFTAGFYDSLGQTVQYQASPGEADITKLFEVKADDVNYPQTYSVNFYEDSTCNTLMTSKIGTVLGATGIAEGTAIADAGITVPVAGTDFDKVNGDGEYFSKFYYVDATGIEQEFDNLATIGAAAAVDSGTEIKVYPKYLPGHTVTFNSEYPADSGLSDKTVNKTVAPTSPGALSKTDAPTVGTSGEDFQIPTGYAFGGWYTGKNGSGDKVVFEETNVTGTDLSGISNVYANWVSQYKVEFVIDKDGTGSNNIVQTLYVDPDATDKTVAKPETDPTKTGYNFKGWYYDNGSGETAFVAKGEQGATEINADTKVYAKWAKLVTVKYYDTKDNATAGTSTGLTDSEEVEAGTKYTDLTKIPSRSDNDTTKKYFDGWYNVAGDTKVDFTSTTATVTSDLTVYEKWGDYYKLDFYKEKEDITGGEGIYKTEYVNPKVDTTLATLPTEPTKANCGFNEWRVYTGGAVTSTKFDTTTTVNGDMTLVADWTEKITITLYPNDGTGSDGLGTKVEKAILPNASLGSEYTVPTRTHYTLKEWNTQANGEGTSYPAALASQTFSASTTLYAIWEVASDVPDSDKVTLTFDSVGGSTVSPITVYKGDTIYAAQMPSNPTKTSATSNPYTFLGWYEAATLSNTNKITAPITMNADKTAYAHWDYTASDAITITFNDNGATTVVNPTTIKIAPNDSIGAAWPTDPAKTDNTFGGWYTDTSDESTKKDKNSTFATHTTLNAKWVANITVIYDTNGGNADGPGTVKKPAGDAYVDPTQTPTKNGVGTHPNYTFLGWNTEQNGSGTYIKAGNKTGSSDPLKYSDLVTGGASSVTLYAQWGALDSTGAPAPEQYAVTVTFDGNGTTQKPVTKEANPKNKYPQLGDSIGTDNMPNDPERTDYTFAGWNTKADGTGTNVTGTTVFDENLDGVTAAGNGTYTSTVYAQWTPATTATTVTVTFNKNTDGKGTDANPITKTIVSGDSLGAAMPADPTNGTYAFDAWYAGLVTDGKLTTSGDALTSSTPISADTTYYAKWTKMLVARMKTNTAEYTGQAINPLFDIYEITWPDQSKPYVLGNRIAQNIDPTTDPDYTITYFKDGPSATEVKDVGTYTFKVQLANTSALAIAGAAIAETDYEENNSRTSAFTVTPKLLTVKVNPDTQIQKAGTTVPLATVKIDGLASTDAEANVIEKKYYKWTPKGDSDTIIDSNELAVEATPTAVAKYVLQVTVKSTNKNYKIDSVVSSKDGTPVLLYEKTATQTYPAFNILNTDNNIVPGTNIVYVIQANDPSISNVDVKSADTKDDEGIAKDPEVVNNLSLKQSDYTSDETFDNAEKPTTKEYYVRVADVGAEEVRFTITLTNPDTTSLTATGGTAVKNTDGTYTVTAPLTSKGATPNVVEITTKAGDAADAPTITYTFNVQQLVEAKITLEYGNSPYGEIMKSSNITDKKTAKEKFDILNKYDSNYIPDSASSKASMTYPTRAWVDIKNLAQLTPDEQEALKDPDINIDRNDTAIFVYNGTPFVDPGYVATDSLGNAINVTRKITVNRMSASQLAGLNDASQVKDDIEIKNKPSKYLITEITMPYNYSDPSTYRIRPDVYTMEYSFEDANQGTVKVERKVVVLQHRGDTYCSDLINDSSVNPVYSYLKTIAMFSGITGTSRNIYFYRVLDTDSSNLINDSDANPVYSYLKTYLPNKDTAKNPLDALYVELPSALQ